MASLRQLSVPLLPKPLVLEGVEKARKVVEQWLAPIGLNLNPKKTRITHTLVAYEGNVGFDLPSA